MSDIKILQRGQHSISRKNISQPALKVLYRLRSKRFLAFLVGGAPRDLLRGRNPRDFDVVTDATIEQILALFRNSKTIGKRFPIVHIYFGNDLVEVSSLKTEKDLPTNAMILADAKERDFTVNAIYYDLNDFRVLDPLGALAHLEKGEVVSIKDPDMAFEEDPIRMLRAAKLAVKQGFQLRGPVASALRRQAVRIEEVGAGRKYEEMTRVLLDEAVEPLLDFCRDHGLLAALWPRGDRLVAVKGARFFRFIREKAPIQYTRGSFAKPSHTHLWLQLYLASGEADLTLDAKEISEGFDRFIHPLGMPFREPVWNALRWLGHLRHEKEEPPPSSSLNREVQKLLEAHVSREEKDLEPALNRLIARRFRKAKKGQETRPPHGKSGARRRRRGRRGRGKHKRRGSMTSR